MSMEGTNFSAPIAVDESTITNTSGTLSVKTGGISENYLNLASLWLNISEQGQRNNYHELRKLGVTLCTHTAGKIIVAYKAVGNNSLIYMTELTVSGSFSLGVLTDQTPYAYGYIGGAQNSYISFPAYFPVSGNYEIIINHWDNNDKGIITVQLDDVTQGTIDCYNATPTANVRTTKSLNAVTAGNHTIKLSLLTKNGSSSAYAIALNEILIEQV